MVDPVRIEKLTKNTQWVVIPDVIYICNLKQLLSEQERSS